MPSQKLVVGLSDKGLRNDVTAFNVDNESFPLLENAYQWRKRVKRRRGTEQLCRLQRTINSFSLGNTDVSGVFLGNLLSGLEANAALTPNTIKIIVGGSQTFTDNGSGVLSNGGGGTGTVNYATGSFTLQTNPVLATSAVVASYNYYPALPVMGLEPFVADSSDSPLELGFDTSYSYNISLNYPYPVNSVSFYIKPSVGGKTVNTPFVWNLADYQQIWTTNYQGALWATPGIRDPFTQTSIGMQFSGITNVGTITATTVQLTVTGPNLVVGDYVFLNEFDPAIITGINFQSGYVSAGSAPGVITVTLPNATMAGPGGATTSGIVQYLTNYSDNTVDCIRWYNGSPTTNSIPQTFIPDKGWVNFCPPLVDGPNDLFTISDSPPGQYYLVGARAILPFKDRLLFFGPVIQTSSANSQIYLQDTVIYSQNGTPYYTASFPGDPSPTTDYTPILLPTNQTAQPSSFWENIPGYGGFLSAGYSRPIITVSPNEDVMIVGFSDRQSRLIYTGNDIIPFSFYIINSELGSDSTFSSITLDKGVITVGGRGFIITSQTQSSRIDLEIPDQVFQIRLQDQGGRRLCAQRDFINEWIYFTYPSNQTSYKFPNQTLLYNYRDESWAIFNESYTTYGTVRLRQGQTWATIGLGPSGIKKWKEWTQPWNSGTNTLLQPQVIGGNQQGFVMLLAQDTREAESLYIKNIVGAVVTSPNHTLPNNTYIILSGLLGSLASMNGKIFIVTNANSTSFTLAATGGFVIPSGTYLGGGLIKRIYRPRIQTKQFPLAWDMARKTRIGNQQYLLSRTDNGQITLKIYLSQDNSNAYNTGPIVPSFGSVNNSLIYSTILYTCPESSNIGLTPANYNLQTPTASTQSQIWHRVNTSLIGDTVQLEFTLSDEQMETVDESGDTVSQYAEIELHAMILDVTPSQLLV